MRIPYRTCSWGDVEVLQWRQVPCMLQRSRAVALGSPRCCARARGHACALAMSGVQNHTTAGSWCGDGGQQPRARRRSFRKQMRPRVPYFESQGACSLRASGRNARHQTPKPRQYETLCVLHGQRGSWNALVHRWRWQPRRVSPALWPCKPPACGRLNGRAVKTSC